LHIAFFTMGMSKGGTERVISNLCNDYLIGKYKLSIVTYMEWHCDYSLDRNINTYSLDFTPNNSFTQKINELNKAENKYIELMKAIQPDVVISFLPRPCIIACLAKNKLEIPVIGSYRGNPEYEIKNELLRLFVKKIFNKADGFVFQTEDAKKFFCKKLQKKSRIIMNPLNDNFVRETYRGKRSKRVVAVGRFTEEKNYQLLIRAFSKVINNYRDYKLVIYGRYDGRLHLKELVKELDLSDYVVFAGQTNDVAGSIYDASLFVLSSMSEGVPNALMEAMALGIPVVSTDCPCGGPATLIQNKENGLLVKNNDVDELANAIDYMLSHPIDAANMAKKATEIGIKYGGKSIYKEWEKYIVNICESKRMEGQ